MDTSSALGPGSLRLLLDNLGSDAAWVVTDLGSYAPVPGPSSLRYAANKSPSLTFTYSQERCRLLHAPVSFQHSVQDLSGTGSVPWYSMSVLSELAIFRDLPDVVDLQHPYPSLPDSVRRTHALLGEREGLGRLGWVRQLVSPPTNFHDPLRRGELMCWIRRLGVSLPSTPVVALGRMEQIAWNFRLRGSPPINLP